MTYLDAQPILDAIDARGGIAACLGRHDLGFDENGKRRSQDWSDADMRDYLNVARKIGKWRESGRVLVEVADEFCIRRLGVNPVLVYGPAFFDGVDEPDGVAAAWCLGDLPLVLDGAA